MNIIKQIISKFKHESSVTPQMLLHMEGMAERNAARIEAIKKEMGDKYILAECHKKCRLEVARPV